MICADDFLIPKFFVVCIGMSMDFFIFFVVCVGGGKTDSTFVLIYDDVSFYFL